jgi:hypothetical protein
VDVFGVGAGGIWTSTNRPVAVTSPVPEKVNGVEG